MISAKPIIRIFFVLMIALGTYAQHPEQYNFDFGGAIRDRQTKLLVPGLQLQFNGPVKVEAFTNANGEFKVLLARGEYELTIDEVPTDTFRAVVKIGGRPSPDYAEFLVDIDPIYSKHSASYPQIKTFQLPKYPPAALAVRARGSVQVIVTVDNSGRVTSAKALSGHPLLIQSSVEAAKNFIFQPTDSSTERSATIHFVFLPFEEKSGQLRYASQYRLNVTAPKPEIDF